MRSSHIARLLLAALIIVFSATAPATAQIDSVWTIRLSAATVDFQVDKSGNVYVTGPKGSPKDMFTARYNTDGTLAWSRQYDHKGQGLEDLAHGIFLDSYDNVYVVGGVWDTAATRVDGIAIKYSSGGASIWTRTTDPGDSAMQFFGDAVCDSSGSVTMTQAAGVPGTWAVMFNSRLNPNGNVVWSNIDSTINGVFYRMGQIATDRSQNVFILGKLHSTGNWTLIKYSPGGSRSWQKFNLGSSATGKLFADGAGNVYALFYAPGVIDKFDQGGNLAWTKSLDVTERYIMAVDGEQNVIVCGGTVSTSTGPYFTAKYDPSGNEMWHSDYGGHILALDRKGTIYVQNDGGILKCIDPHDGELLWEDTLIFPGVHKLDHLGNIYVRNTWMIIKYSQDRAIIIRDAHNDTIPNVEFNLIRVANDPPVFTEDTLGSFTTDSEGRLELTEVAVDTFTVDLSTGTKQLVVGDSLKIAKHVQSVPAAKHPMTLGTMYSVHLDNAHFDEDGEMHFDTLTASGMEVVLNHTELRYNLLASVEWEATGDYLGSLQDNFRFMSNYLYDVTDGQLRLDTVYIFDNNVLPDQADVLIHASNLQWPVAHAGGIVTYGVGHIYMPRIFMGDSTSMRNYTDQVYPLNLTAYSTDYRTKAHEFGHYALNFFDEYLFWSGGLFGSYSADNSLRCLPTTVFRYGFMDSQYEGSGVMSSEMSGVFRYDMASCRNTNQWGVHSLPCWDHLERWVEAVTWGADNLYVPILKPDAADDNERVVTTPAVFFAGPNDNMADLDYNVGAKVVFPNPPSPQAAGYSDKHVTVSHTTGGDNADVQLINDPLTSTKTIINQGRTSDAAGAWVVGVKNASYQILAGKGGSGATVTPSPFLASAQEVTTDWLYGMAESGGSGVSKIGNRYAANSAEDSITIELNEVQGYYPLICEAELLATGVKYDLTSVQPFSADPTLQLWPSYGGTYDHTFTASGNGYDVVVADSLGTSGSFTLWAVDDSAATFFVPTGYVATDVSHDQPFIWLLGCEGWSEFKLDSTNGTLERALILSSPYPVVRTGLDPNAVQAGQAHSLSVYPDDPLAGTNQIVIRYDDGDLKLGVNLLGDESALAVYHWADASTGWELVGGTVDTANNALYAPVSETGVYAAFTTDIVADVEEDERGDILPYQFELSQNYPNPFNPVTTIEYSLPSRTDVTIEVFNVLGQKVRTLVNETKSAGSYRTEWNGIDDAGRPISTGVYLYRFSAGDLVQTKKMLLIK